MISAIAGFALASTALKPNIVIIFCDDAGYGDFGFNGHPTIRTPNLDQMAAEGMHFTSFYSGNPVCTPSRYALLTGREPRRSGLDEGGVLFPPSVKGIHVKEVTIAEGLKEEGYRTGIFGKWHLGWPNKNNGMDMSRLPLSHGFDKYWGVPYSNDMRNIRDYGKLPIVEGPYSGTDSELVGYSVHRIGDDQGMLTRRATEEVVEFIDGAEGDPFFAYVPYYQ
jgi:arylsulfatase